MREEANVCLQEHDSFAGFRSDFIHFSISVVANEPDSPANSIHLTPNGFYHFWSWWHLFDGTMSLPIRHGKAFPSTQPASKKFGKHCATIKYRAQLAPVFISHTYKQDDWADWGRGRTTFLGLKGRMESFSVDLHQREELDCIWSEGLQQTRKRLHKPFWRAEIDCVETDLRVIAAAFKNVEKAAFDPDQDEDVGDSQDDATDPLGLDDAPDLEDEELPWSDLDDFYDLHIRLSDINPSLKLARLLRAPRLTYSRYAAVDKTSSALQRSDSMDTSKNDDISGSSKFDAEPTHKCLLDHAPSESPV